MTDVALLTLGCPKNLVDSEVMLTLLRKAGFNIREAVTEAEVVIINTCSFIAEAKRESIDTILEVAGLKKTGKLKALIVAGCLAQRYPELLAKGGFPEVDAILGCADFPRIAGVVKEALAGRRVTLVSAEPRLPQNLPFRTLITPRHYAYLKVSEGCDNRCNYCIIPHLRGRYQSRPLRQITAEAEELIRRGVKEINLVSQDLTLYGKDRYPRLRLTGLLKRLARIKGLKWLRLLYCHPRHFHPDLIPLIRDEEKICRYLDLPVQHISKKMLKLMGRKITPAQIRHLIGRLRQGIPGLALRTSVMVGFPGEKEEDFQELLDFIRTAKFEHLGAFAYSREEGTPAYDFPGQVPERVKRARLEEVMKVQQEVVTEQNRLWLGKTVRVLIDEADPSDKSALIGRTELFAPEVDGLVFVRTKNIDARKKIGRFLKVKITDTYEYDLVGEEIR